MKTSGEQSIRHDRVVTPEGGAHRFAVRFPALRAALDVGEQQGHRPARKFAGFRNVHRILGLTRVAQLCRESDEHITPPHAARAP